MSDALQTNAADERQLAHARRVEKERARRELALWRQFFSQRDMRELWWDVIMPALGLRESGLHLDPHQLYALEGRREVARKFEALAARNFPQQYLEAQGEAIERNERQTRENQAARATRASE